MRTFELWETRALALLEGGAFDKLDEHMLKAASRFAAVASAAARIQRIQRQRTARERKAIELYQQFRQVLGQTDRARLVLEELKRSYPDSPWLRKAEKLWKAR